MVNQCHFTRPNGQRCKATVQAGKELCVFHDPARAEQVRQARRAGGITRTRGTIILPTHAPYLPLQNQMEIAALLAETINQVRRGQLDARTANTICFLSNALSRVLDQGSTEQRLAKLEAQQERQRLDDQHARSQIEGGQHGNTESKAAN